MQTRLSQGKNLSRTWPQRMMMGCGLLVACVLAACAGPKPVPLNPMVLRFLPERGELANSNGDRLALEDVAPLLEEADFVLVGEGHTSVCDHAFQRRILALMLKGGQRPAVGLEMVGADLQPVLDRFAAGELDLETLPTALDWKTIWGYPFSLFAPQLGLAQAYGLPVAGINAPRRLVKAVGRQGLEGLSPEDREQLPREIIPPPNGQREFLQRLFGEHATRGLGSGELERFLTVQALWDTAMAQNALGLHRSTGRPVLVFAGSGHVERGWGIASRLRILAPKAKVVALVPLRDATEFHPEDGDVLFYCPPAFESRMGMTIEAREGRIVVVAVRPESRAERVGIRPGDRLVEAQGRPMHGFMDLHRAGKQAHEQGQSLTLVVERQGVHYVVDVGRLGKHPEKKKGKE